MGLFKSLGKILKSTASLVGVATGNPWLAAGLSAGGTALGGGNVGQSLLNGAASYLGSSSASNSLLGNNNTFIGNDLPTTGGFTGGNGSGSILGSSGLTSGLGLLSLLNSYKTDADYQKAKENYANLVGTGPTAYKFSPTERAAYIGKADSDIGTVQGQRADTILSNLGSRGLLNSGISVSELSGVGNWQDTQRTNANAALAQLGYDRGYQAWQNQLNANQGLLQTKQTEAQTASDAFSTFLANLGLSDGISVKPRVATTTTNAGTNGGNTVSNASVTPASNTSISVTTPGKLSLTNPYYKSKYGLLSYS